MKKYPFLFGKVVSISRMNAEKAEGIGKSGFHKQDERRKSGGKGESGFHKRDERQKNGGKGESGFHKANENPKTQKRGKTAFPQKKPPLKEAFLQVNG